jgi:hypothetical protein
MAGGIVEVLGNVGSVGSGGGFRPTVGILGGHVSWDDAGVANATAIFCAFAAALHFLF